MKYADAVKERVDALLEETGLKATDLIAAMRVSSSTYYDMWKNGYVTVDRMGAMAEALGVLVARLLPPGDAETVNAVSEPPATYRADRPRYIEDRIEWLESEVRKLKEQARPR